MTEAEWLACDDPKAMLDFLRTKAADRKLRLFGVACCYRMIEDMRVDSRCQNAIEVVERFADGEVAETEVDKARDEVGQCGFGNWVSACEWLSAASGFSGGATHRAWQVAAFAATGLFQLLFQHVGTIGQSDAKQRVLAAESKGQTDLLRDIFGNTFRTVALDPAWLTSTVTALAQQMYESRDFGAMPILADALQDAGCDSDDVLGHCRGPGPHVRGCWVVDLVLGKA
jgi:hypothetical protein